MSEEAKKLTAREQLDILNRAYEVANSGTPAGERLSHLLAYDQAHVTKTEFNEGKIIFTSEFGEFLTIWTEGPED